MDEKRFEAALEAKLDEERTRRRQEADEAERLRIANEPAERERVEATSLLRREMRELGSMFVDKANQLGIRPNVVFDTKTDNIIEKLWYKPFEQYRSYHHISLRIRPDGNMFIEERVEKPGGGDYDWSINRYSTAEPNERGVVYIGYEYGCSSYYNQFAADSFAEANRLIEDCTTAAIGLLSQLVTDPEGLE